MSDNNFIQVGEMTACGHCEPEKYGEGMRQAQDRLGDKMPSCTCKCHTKGICITCYENCQTVGTCPHVAPKNVLTDIKTEHLKELRESGVEITEVAPKEEEWEKEFDEKFLTDFGMEIVSWNVEDPSPGEIKHFIREHFIPKERVEKVLGGCAVVVRDEVCIPSENWRKLLSLLSEDK